MVMHRPFLWRPAPKPLLVCIVHAACKYLLLYTDMVNSCLTIRFIHYFFEERTENTQRAPRTFRHIMLLLSTVQAQGVMVLVYSKQW
jgi:hypothetical protein